MKFWFPSVYKSHVYTMLQSIKSAAAFNLKKNVYTLSNTNCIAKKYYHLSLQ